MIDLTNEVPQADKAFALDWYKDEGYTNIGQAVFDIKYGHIQNHTLKDSELDRACRYLVNQLEVFTKDVDIILPVPSFNPKHQDNPCGVLKIMYMITERLGEASGKMFDFSILEKTSSSQAKDSQLNESDYISKKLPPQIKRVLLVDDLFGEGNTANYTVSALKGANPTIFIRFVSLTKNKYGGIHKCYDCRISQYSPHSIMDKGDESIELYFYKNDRAQHVKIWSSHKRFQEVKDTYEKKDFNKVFEFSIYKKQNGYWQIDDD